jgi:hypothetical protein
MFDSGGYELIFVQRDRIKKQGNHLESYIFKFFSNKSKTKYIIKADYHKQNVFAIKFYPKIYKYLDEKKYHRISNKGDVSNVLITCVKVIPKLLKIYPSASFSFIASPSIDNISDRVEDYQSNQRFRIYRQLVIQKIGSRTFDHFEFDEVSAYMLVNRSNLNIESYVSDVSTMFIDTYDDLLTI